MPIETRVEKEKNLTIHTATGALTFSEIVKTLEAFYRSEGFTENVLWDGRRATLKDLSHEQLNDLPIYSRKFKQLGIPIKSGKRALVVSSSVDFGLARIINSFKDTMGADIPLEVRTFRTIEEALRWLTERPGL